MLPCGCAESFKLVTMTKFAEICCVSRNAVWYWKEHRQGFPQPVLLKGNRPMWQLWQVRYWERQRAAKQKRPTWKRPSRATLPEEAVEHLRDKDRSWRRQQREYYKTIKHNYRTRHIDRVREKEKLQEIEARANLNDKYVRMLLSRRIKTKICDIPEEYLPELTDLLRGVILLKRELRATGVRVSDLLHNGISKDRRET
jgi:predicted DNA-binding transcriptional regulator AlpA